jgi:DnaJ-class molecular chaperone
MNTQKDYYKILGVAFNASDKEIKAAYRKAAQDHHPDKYSGNSSAIKEQLKAMFQDINEAYEVLTTKRAEYDSSYALLSPGNIEYEAPPENGTIQEDIMCIFKTLYISAKNNDRGPEWLDDFIEEFGVKSDGTFENSFLHALLRDIGTKGEDTSEYIEVYKMDSIAYRHYTDKINALGCTEFAEAYRNGVDGLQNPEKATSKTEMSDADKEAAIAKGVGLFAAVFGFFWKLLGSIDGSDD